MLSLRSVKPDGKKMSLWIQGARAICLDGGGCSHCMGRVVRCSGLNSIGFFSNGTGAGVSDQ